MGVKVKLEAEGMEPKNKICKKESMRLAILTEPIFPLLVKTSIPTVIGMLVSAIYNLTDTFFVGILNNSSMTAAIGVVFSFFSIIQAIGFWYGYGSGNRMAKKIGEGSDNEAEDISLTGIVLAIGSGILIAVLARIFIVPLANLIGGNASEKLLYFTVEYLKIIILSIPFSLYVITLYNQLRLCGNVKVGMTGLLVGMISNILLDPIIMFGFKTGFLGAGYATLISQIIGCVTLTLLTEKHGNSLVSISKVKYNKEHMYHILLGGMPNFSRQTITSVALVLLNITAAKYGESLIAALTITARITAFAYLLMIGWGQGMQPICAMNYGARRYARVKKIFVITVMTGTIFLILAASVLYIFSEQFVRSMSNDEEVLLAAIPILRMQCITMPFLGYFAITSMAMQNVGKYLVASFLSISRQGMFYIPLLYILPSIYGKFGIYLLQPVADVLAFIFSIMATHRYKILHTR